MKDIWRHSSFAWEGGTKPVNRDSSQWGGGGSMFVLEVSWTFESRRINELKNAGMNEWKVFKWINELKNVEMN